MDLENLSRIPLNGKKPIPTNWQQWSYRIRPYDPAEFKGRNTGIVCGPASNRLVLDVDDPQRFQDTCRQKGWNIPETLTIETGTGKPHYYFTYPNNGRPYGNKSFGEKAKLNYGFDLRGAGGQVVAPGSIHPDTGRAYRVALDIEPAEPPRWLLDLYAEPKAEPTTCPDSWGFSGDIDGLPIKAETKDLIKNSVPVGGRSEAIMRALNALVWSRLSDSEIVGIFERYGIGEKYREKGAGRERWLAPQIAKARASVTQFAENRTFGTSSGRLKNDNSSNENRPLDVSDVSSNGNSDFLPAVPSFPLEVLPDALQVVVSEHGEAFAVPVDVPAMALLSLSGACIGRTRGITIKAGWSEHANTFIATVGRSGAGKSPVTRSIQNPVFNHEARWFRSYQDEMKEYEAAVERRKGISRKDRINLDPPPDPPIYKQLLIDDSTTEALTKALSQNPRGIMWNRDEISGLILDLDKYSGKDGGTKARLMSAYDSGPWKVNRNSGNQYISNACLSIFGTIQDKALPDIFSSKDAITGFLPRFNFIRVEQDAPPMWSDAVVSERSKTVLYDLIKSLLAYDFKNGEPVFIGVQREAKALFIDWFNQQAIEPWASCESATYEALLAKLRGQCLRFALILHCIDAVVHGVSEKEPVNTDIMGKAIILANYLKEHQKSVWQLCFSNGKVKQLKPFEKRIAEAILALENEIKNGMLPTQSIVDYINNGLDERFQTNTRSVGKAFKGLGLQSAHLPDKSGRGPKISPEFIEKMKNTLSKRPKRPKRPTCEYNSEILPNSNVRQSSQTSGIMQDEVIL